MENKNEVTKHSYMRYKLIYTIIFLFGLLLLPYVLEAQTFDNGLQQIMTRAIQQSHAQQINQLQLQQARINQTIARQYYLPKITNSATYTRLNDDIVFPAETQQLLTGTQRLLIKEAIGLPFNSSLPPSIVLKPVPSIQERNIFKITSNVQMVLFSGFKASLSKKITIQQQQAFSSESSSGKVKIIKEVWELYDKLALVNSSYNVITAIDNYLQQQNNFIEKAISNGLATPIDREKINLARHKLTLRKIELNGDKKLVLEKLVVITAINADSIASFKPEMEVIFLPDMMIRKRPELDALDAGIKAFELKSKMELTEYIPKIVAFAQYDWRKQDLSLFDPRWYAGIRLQWSLFDGLVAKNESKKAIADKEILIQKRKEFEENIAILVSKTEIDKNTADEKMKVNREALLVAERIKELTEKQYKNGLTTITELLDAVAAEEKARQELLQSIYDQRRATATNLEATGNLLQFFNF